MVDLSAEALLEYDQIVNTTFSCENEGLEFYKSYALKKGFGVRRGYFEKDKANNEVKEQLISFEVVPIDDYVDSELCYAA